MTLMQTVSVLYAKGYLFASSTAMKLTSGKILRANASTGKQNLTTDDINGLFKDSGAAGTGGALEGASKAANSLGAGGFSLARTIAIYGAAIALVMFFGGLVLHGRNVQKRGEYKDGAPSVAIGIIGIFAVIGILAFANTIGSNLLTN